MKTSIATMLAAVLLLASAPLHAQNGQVSCCQGAVASGEDGNPVTSCFDLGTDSDGHNRNHCLQNGGTLTTGSCDEAGTGLCGGTTVCCRTTDESSTPSCLQTTAGDCMVTPFGDPRAGKVCGANGECGDTCPAPPPEPTPPPEGKPNGANCTGHGECQSRICRYADTGLCGSTDILDCRCIVGENPPPTPTPPPGPRPDGDPCGSDVECQSGECAGLLGDVCLTVGSLYTCACVSGGP